MLFTQDHLRSSKPCKAGCIRSLWLQYRMIQFSDARTTWIYLLVLKVRSLNWGSLGNIGCWQGCVTSVGFRGELVSLPFPGSRSFLHLLGYGPFLYVQSQEYSTFKSISLSLTLQPPPHKDPCDYIRLKRKIQNELCILISLT